jgi:hypothetical protein
VGSDAHAVDSAQQLALTHEAHTFVPYGRPQMLVTRSSGGLSVMPTSWRQARTPITMATAEATRAKALAERGRPGIMGLASETCKTQYWSRPGH